MFIRTSNLFLEGFFVPSSVDSVSWTSLMSWRRRKANRRKQKTADLIGEIAEADNRQVMILSKYLRRGYVLDKIQS